MEKIPQTKDENPSPLLLSSRQSTLEESRNRGNTCALAKWRRANQRADELNNLTVGRPSNYSFFSVALASALLPRNWVFPRKQDDGGDALDGESLTWSQATCAKLSGGRNISCPNELIPLLGERK